MAFGARQHGHAAAWQHSWVREIAATCVQLAPTTPVTPTQGFINASFAHIKSTENALSLLAQFQALLQRDMLVQVRMYGRAFGLSPVCRWTGSSINSCLSRVGCYGLPTNILPCPACGAEGDQCGQRQLPAAKGMQVPWRVAQLLTQSTR